MLGSVSGAVPVLLLVSATRLCDSSKLRPYTGLVSAYRSDPLGKKKISTSVGGLTPRLLLASNMIWRELLGMGDPPNPGYRCSCRRLSCLAPM